MNARPYAVQMQRVLGSLAARVDPSVHPLLQQRETRADSKTLVILVTGDKGLCGSFNTNAIKGAGNYITGSDQACQLALIGRKGKEYFGRRGFEIAFDRTGQDPARFTARVLQPRPDAIGPALVHAQVAGDPGG